MNSDLCTVNAPDCVAVLNYVCLMSAGNDDPVVPEASRAHLQVCERLYDGAVNTQRSAVADHPVSCAKRTQKYATRTSTSVLGLFSYNSTVNTSVRQFMQHFMRIMVSFAGSVRRNFLPDKRHDSKHI